MNLYLRLLLTLLTAPLQRRIEPLETSVTRWRVLPTDLDAFGHMNNARYLAVMDLARVDFLVRLGLAKDVIEKRWIAPIGSVRVDFRGSLGPLERYEVHTRVVYWDDKWFYIRQDFRREADPSRIVAIGWVKVVFRGAKANVRPEEVIAGRASRPVLDDEAAREFKLRPDAAPPVAPLPMAAREPIAIVGIGCRLPGGARDPEALWQLLDEGREAIVDIPESRWDPKKFHDPSGASPGRTYVQRAGLLEEDVRAFDAAFFGITPREAATLDPQQRLLLEVSWEAFEDAGVAPGALAKTRTGVFVGGFMTDNLLIHANPDNRDRIGTHSATASTLTMLSNRLSYFFDLRGPSVSIDTACSSSLVAVHLACQSLWSGESEAALAGGVNVILVPETHITMAKGKFLSPRGRCHAFSDQADGYVRAEGAAVLLLKPLSAAERDGDHVYAVIQGTATNQDGRTNGITLPNADAQVAVMREAYARAGVSPTDVAYVEAHGTGTPAGDPIEARAIGTVLGEGRTGAPCLLGSIKTNLGHLEAAAGVTGVIKAALVLQRGEVPRHVLHGRPNPAIPFDELRLALPTTTTPLPGTPGARFCGVNSFGYGGTNAHVVLGEAPRSMARRGGAQPTERRATRPALLPLSARSPEALASLAARYADALEAGADFAALGDGAAVHRTHHRHRAAVFGDAPVAALRALERGERDAAGLAHLAERPEGKLLFVYTGMGPQWWAMGRELLASEPVFREAVEEADAAFRDVAGFSILAEMLADEGASRMARTEIAQPANAALQIGLTRLWASWGVSPDGAIGHSIGEVGSAFGAGALDVRGAMTAAFHRSRLQQRLAGRGGMLAASVTPDEARAIVTVHGRAIAIAAVNSDTSVTLAGDTRTLERVARDLEADGRFCRMLRVEVPYHSPVMDEIEGEILASLRDLSPRLPSIPLYSTVLGRRTQEELFDGRYFWQNVRQTVWFAPALEEAIADGYAVFVEIGPHPVLAASIRELLRGKRATGEVVASLVRKEPEQASMTSALARLYAAGVEIDHARALGRVPHAALPKYPWQKKTHWSESERSARRRHARSSHPLLAAEETAPTPTFTVDPAGARWLYDHVVGDAAIFPAAGYVELALAARHAIAGDARCSIEQIELERAAPIRPDEKAAVILTMSPDTPAFRVHHRTSEGAPAAVARGKIFSAGSPGGPLDLDSIAARLHGALGSDELYASLERRGLRYGPAFRAVQSVLRGDRELLARLALPEALDARGYHLHPVLLDAALHALIGLSDGESGDVVPVAIDRVHVVGEAARELVVHARLVSRTNDELRGDVTIARPDGAIVCAVEGLRCRVLAPKAASTDLGRATYRRVWEELPPWSRNVSPIRPSLDDVSSGGWVVLGGDAGARALDVSDANGPVRVLDLRFRALDGDDPVAAGAAACEALLGTLRAIEAGRVSRYVLVTTGAEAVTEPDGAPSLAAAPLLGLARTAMTERPDLNLTLLDAEPGAFDLAKAIAEVERLSDEQEIARRGGSLYVARIVRVEAEEDDARVAVSEGGAYELVLGEAAKLDAIGFAACARRALAEGEVEIEVEVSSLGFKDIMKALGLLSARVKANTYFGDSIGMEGAGVIARVGPGVTDLAVGDRVYGVAPRFLDSHVVLPASRVVKLPSCLDAEAGSNLVVFMTVHHALVDIARLRPGERVLIHSAAGGVGLAAIEVARACGAEVIATAGTEEKRRFLREHGVAHVSHSRDLQFADDVRAWTGGRGVDVVLNFTPGEIMLKSVASLAPFGRFIEIGKMSFDQDAALQLRAFNENLLYAAIDFDRILEHKPEEVRAIGREVVARIEQGIYRPVPSTTFPASEVHEAFRYMARGKHTGKICVRHRDPALRVRPMRDARVSPDATYLVTGGLGGFGLEVARWLAASGARHLALVSRSGPAAKGADAALAELRSAGVDVRAFAADVGVREDVDRVLDEIQASMPALRGVVHSATVVDDRVLADLDRASLDRVLHAKARGAWNLHLATEDAPLDFFVAFSSISSLIGNGGQGNYVAANAFLDQLAAFRRRRGLPATSLQWGVLRDAGLVARDERLGRHLERLGIRGLSTEAALEALGRVLDDAPEQVAVVDVDWAAFLRARRDGSGGARFATLAREVDLTEEAPSATPSFGDLDDDAALAAIVPLARARVASVMRVPVDDLDPRVPLRDAGMDSLMALEIVAELEAAFAVKVPSMAIANGPSIEELASILLSQLRGARVAAAESTIRLVDEVDLAASAE